MMLNFEGIFIQLILLSSSLILHELCHYLAAYILGYEAKFKFENFLIPTVTYRNEGDDKNNLIISISGPAIVFLFGLLIPKNIAILSLFKILCILNIFHLLPFFNDGQVILMSLIKLLKRGVRH